MAFFRDRTGRIHGLRIAGVLYFAGLWLGCSGASWSITFETLTCLARIMFAIGWWLAFCDKQPPATLSVLYHPRHRIGILLTVTGLLVQYAIVGRSGRIG